MQGLLQKNGKKVSLAYEFFQDNFGMGGVNLVSFLGLRKYKVSMFTLIIADEIIISEGVKIGAFNLIICKSLQLGKCSKIGNFNFIKGRFSVDMGVNAKIGNFNRISCSSKVEYHPVKFKMGDSAHVVSNHLFDMTDNVTLGSHTVIAGAGTQFWTHSYYITEEGKEIRVDAPVSVGRRCYVGARCVILSGVDICDGVTVGAMTCVSKSIMKTGVYVGGPIRYLPKDPEFLKKLGSPSVGNSVYRKHN